MATKRNIAQIALVLKSEVKELLVHMAEKEGTTLNHMCQILLIEALAARFRKKKMHANNHHW